MLKEQRRAASLLGLQTVIIVKPEINWNPSPPTVTSSFAPPSLILVPIPTGRLLVWASCISFPYVACLISGFFSNAMLLVLQHNIKRVFIAVYLEISANTRVLITECQTTCFLKEMVKVYTCLSWEVFHLTTEFQSFLFLLFHTRSHQSTFTYKMYWLAGIT